jgi:hypothetical protein
VPETPALRPTHLPVTTAYDIDEETAADWADAVRIIEQPRYWGGHVPHAHQHAFLWLDCLDALYGGATGGGKSDALLMAATQYCDIPGYAALLLRRQFSDLNRAGALMDRATSWLAGTDARWNDQKHQWTFPSGARLEFGYVRNLKDLQQYQSAEYQFIGIDELTQWPKRFALYMFSRLRSGEATDPDSPLASIPLRFRAATNPGGPGHHWVKQRYIDKVPDEDNPDETQEDRGARIFIPARLDDNPSIDRKPYLLALAQLDPATQAQLLDGDWNAREPGDWVIHDHTWIDAAVDAARWLVPTLTEPAGEHLHIAIDWGEITQAYTIWPLEQGGIYVPPSETVAKHDEPGTVTPRILQQAVKFGFPISAAHYDAAGVQSMRTFLKTARSQRDYPELRKMPSVKVAFSKYKRLSINYMRLLFRRVAEGHTTRIIVIHPANKELIRQLRSWERKGPESDDVIKEDDHGPDALTAGLAKIAERHLDAMIELIEQAKKGPRPLDDDEFDPDWEQDYVSGGPPNH